MGFFSGLYHGAKNRLNELWNRGSTVITGGYYLGPFNSLTDEYRRTHPPVDKADEAGLNHDLEYTDIARLAKDKKITSDVATKLTRESDNKFLSTMRNQWTTSPWKTTLGYIGIKGKNILEDIGVINPNIFVREKKGGMIRRMHHITSLF
jgi:hypothetical protein